MKFSKWILVFMLVFLLVFTVMCLYITFRTTVEPSTLIMSVFAFCGVEGGLMAWIKNTKTKSVGKEIDDMGCKKKKPKGK